MAAEFNSDPEVMVVLNDARLVDEKLRPSGRTQYGNIRSARAPDNYFNTGCCSAHRRVWQWLTLPVPEWIGYHDVWINFFAHETGHARILPIALQDYRRHGLNVTNWILSDPAGATALQLFRVHGLKDARDGWRLTDRILEEMQQRLNSVDASSSPLPQSLLERARKRIAAHRQALDHQIALCSTPRLRRPAAFAAAVACGRISLFPRLEKRAEGPGPPVKPRVVHLTYALDFGGVEKHLQLIARASGKAFEHRFVAIHRGGAAERAIREAGSAVTIMGLDPHAHPIRTIAKLVSLFAQRALSRFFIAMARRAICSAFRQHC